MDINHNIMEKICWANTDDFEESEFVIIGIPDESQSHALRKGTEDAPNKIRQISNLRDSFERNGKTTNVINILAITGFIF